MRLWLLITFWLISTVSLVNLAYSETKVLFNLNDPQQFKKEFFNLISHADNYIKIVTFNFDFEEIEEILIKKSLEGVKIFLVVDDTKSINVKYLQLSGIQILDDRVSNERNGLVHSKFVIIDGRYVWFGSANITETSFLRDHNFAFISDDESIIEVFEKEFDNNFLACKFHSSKIDFSNEKIGIFFAPIGNISHKIAEALSKADEEVLICAYAFTNFVILNQLKILASNGVKVRLILDENWNLYSSFKYSVLENAIDFFKIKLDPFDGLLHDKFILIDPEKNNGCVIAGSYNFTLSADTSNDEFCIFLSSSNILREFKKEFERIWAESQEF